MHEHQVLPGLPATGPLPEQFAPEGGSTHSEGFVVRFGVQSSEDWVGNSQPGLGSFSAVLKLDRARVLVIAFGQAYMLDPATRVLERTFGGCISYAAFVPAIEALLLHNDLWFETIGSGANWRSPRVSWDGIRAVRIHEATLHGEAYDPMIDEWAPFKLNLTTGTPTGGTYSGP